MMPKLKLLFLVTAITAATILAGSVRFFGSVSNDVPGSTVLADTCEADESRFRGSIHLPTALASSPATPSNGMEMSVQYFCACHDRVARCRWRSATALARME